VDKLELLTNYFALACSSEKVPRQGYDGVCTDKLLDALMATTASTSYFPPRKLRSRLSMDSGSNEPAVYIISESSALFDKHPDLIVSFSGTRDVDLDKESLILKTTNAHPGKTLKTLDSYLRNLEFIHIQPGKESPPSEDGKLLAATPLDTVETERLEQLTMSWLTVIRPKIFEVSRAILAKQFYLCPKSQKAAVILPDSSDNSLYRFVIQSRVKELLSESKCFRFQVVASEGVQVLPISLENQASIVSFKLPTDVKDKITLRVEVAITGGYKCFAANEYHPLSGSPLKLSKGSSGLVVEELGGKEVSEKMKASWRDEEEEESDLFSIQ